MFERTDAFEAFIAPARSYPQLWRVIVSLMIGGGVYLLGAMLTIALYFGIDPGIEAQFQLAMSSEDAGAPVAVTGLLLATFIAMLMGAFAMCILHKRSPLTLLGRHPRFWTLLALGALLVVAGHSISGVFQALFLPMELEPHHSWTVWSGFLIWALPLLVVQITAEELVFRGYLQQQLAARFQSMWIWMVLPSVLFALGHFQEHLDSALAWKIVFATALFGVVAADLTRLTGTLAPAIGLHLANNFTAIFVVSTPGPLSGLALYHTTFSLADPEVIAPYIWLDILVLFGVWIAARRILR